MTQTADIPRWTFTVPTSLGDTHSTYEVRDDALHFESDDPLGGGAAVLRWESVQQGATASMAGMGGRGGPDMPSWVPEQLEWLLLSRTGGSGEAFMRVLPQGPDRDAIVAAVRQRLASRWLGERLPLIAAQRQLGIEPDRLDQLKVIGIVVSVLCLLVLLVVVLALLLHPVVAIPASLLGGGWLLRKGRQGLRDRDLAATTKTSKVATAAPGFVELEGRAVAGPPVPAAISGKPSVWWDVVIHVWYQDRVRTGEWRQMAARHGGAIDVVEIEDETGRLPIWLKDADLLLEARSWESQKDELPTHGLAFLDSIGFPWNDGRRIRVTETCLELNGALYVLGTLGERRSVPEAQKAGLAERLARSLRTGEWRRNVVAAVPRIARQSVAILIGYVDMLVTVALGSGGERARRPDSMQPPTLAPSARLVWKGDAGRPFLVSNRTEQASLESLRTRSLFFCGLGVAALCFVVYQLFELFKGS